MPYPAHLPPLHALLVLAAFPTADKKLVLPGAPEFAYAKT